MYSVTCITRCSARCGFGIEKHHPDASEREAYDVHVAFWRGLHPSFCPRCSASLDRTISLTYDKAA